MIDPADNRTIPLFPAGLSISVEVQREIEAGALFVVNHSGGKDSQAMLIELLEIIPAAQILVVHATLGRFEWKGALEHAKTQALNAGVPFITAESKKSFLEMVMNRYLTRPSAPSWPGAKYRQCTSDLKRGPITRETRRYAKNHGFTRIVNCMGMRSQESPARAKQHDWKMNPLNSVAGRTWFDWLPIHAISESEVFQIIARAGQQLHHAYRLGNRRLSCLFCIFACANDLINAARTEPELYAEFVAMEKRTGYTMHVSQIPLEQITGIAA